MMPSLKTSGNSFLLGLFLHSDLDEAELSPVEFRVYAHLCRRANDQQRCWGSQKNMAAHCRVSTDTVGRALKVLEARGLIKREEEYRADGSRTVDTIIMLGLSGADLGAKPTPPPRKNNTTPSAKTTPPPPHKPRAEVYPLEVNPLEVNPLKQQQRSTPVWKLWVAHCDLKGPSLEANQQEWNEWMGMGMGEELETQAREVIKLGKGDGGYKFPVAGLSCRMKGKINVQHAKLERRVSEEFSAAAVLERQAITPGSRWLHPGSGLACQVAEITGTTVFFEDGGPIEEIWLSHMAGWKALEGDAPKGMVAA